MKSPYSSRLAIILIIILLPACSTGGYWIPPLSTSTPPPILDMLSGQATQTAQAAFTPTPLPPEQPTATPDSPVPTQFTPQDIPAAAVDEAPILYYAQAADSLPVVAVRFGVDPTEIQSPDPIPEKAFINPGQMLIIPRRLANTTSSVHLMPDSEVVYSPSATDLDLVTYVLGAGGRLSTYQSWFKSTGISEGAAVVSRVALENSINPRLLLSLLEYQSHWVLGQPQNLAEDDYPMGLVNLQEQGLYNQLVWAVNQLSIGYYAYREGRLTEIRFTDGVTARLAPDLNAGTAALQYFFAQLYDSQRWLQALDPVNGFPALHERMFGSPWLRAQQVEPLFPSQITQPPLALPFLKNVVWSYTGGPHGAWEHDGAYAALDFAPGTTEPGCQKSNAWVAASADGLVVRSGNGVVVLDLDGDGLEQTGWVVLYLHVSAQQRIPVGTWVATGDLLGHPSCEGGVSTGTHVHIARKYNGEWIPADGPLPFNLGGWVASAGSAAYLGALERDGVTITSCTCGSAATRIQRRADDP